MYLGRLVIVSRWCGCQVFSDVDGTAGDEHGAGTNHQRLLHKVQTRPEHFSPTSIVLDPLADLEDTNIINTGWVT